MLSEYVKKVDKSTETSRDANNPTAKYAMVIDELDYLKEDVREKYTNRNNSYYGEAIYSVDFDPSISSFGYGNYNDMLSVANNELQKMRYALSTGIYEFFQEKWKSIHREEKTRNSMKKLWISYVFGKPTFLNPKMRRLWEIEFPLLNKIILHFKKSDYRILAHTLQRTESDIIYNQVCSAIDNKLDIPYCTVHDSIIVKEKHLATTKDIFSATLVKNNVVTGVK